MSLSLKSDAAGSCPDDDWEQDFDVDITEEDLKKAQEAVKNLTTKSPLKELYKTTDDHDVRLCFFHSLHFFTISNLYYYLFKSHNSVYLCKICNS